MERQMITTTPLEVAIVGGGRSERRLCKALAGLRQVRKVHLVSPRNARAMQDWIGQQGLATRVALHGKLDPVLWDPEIKAAIVANPPMEHFPTARWLLEYGKHVLVEEPFVPSEAEAQRLVDMAEARGLVIAVGLEYFLASYLHYFRSVVHNQGHPHPVERTTVTWHDVVRDGAGSATRSPNVAHVVADMLPHVLSLLTVLFGRHAARTAGVTMPASFSASLELDYGPHPVAVSLSRAGREPRRSIEIVTRDERRFVLDFTREPGIVLQDGRVLPPDPLWDSLPKPVSAQLAYFLDETRERQGTLPLLARETMHVVQGTEEACAKAGGEELNRLRGALAVEDYLAGHPAARPTGLHERR
jgi:predicted dehydrogenase